MINNKDLDKYVEDDNETYELLDLTPEECEEYLSKRREEVKKQITNNK